MSKVELSSIVKFKEAADFQLRDSLYDDAIKSYTKTIVQLWKVIESVELSEAEITKCISDIGVLI